jgi:hypothetical protein
MNTFQNVMIILAVATIALLAVLVMRKRKEGFATEGFLPSHMNLTKEDCREIRKDKAKSDKVRNDPHTVKYQQKCKDLGLPLNL